MKLSIIIVNFNTANLTHECVNSIIDQKLSFEYEIIVVDNGSTDKSYEIFKKYEINKDVKIVYNRKNLGYAKGINVALKRSKGRYILILNSDIVVNKHAIERLLKFASKTKDAGIVGPQLVNPDGTRQPSCMNLPSVKNALLEYWLGKTGSYEKFIPASDKATAVDCVVGAVMMITPQGFKAAGLFDERYFMYYEDHDYCRRMKDKGLRVYYYPQSQFMHYHGKSGEVLADKSNQWRRLIPSSKIYNGILKYYLLNYILWTGQKFNAFKKAVKI